MLKLILVVFTVTLIGCSGDNNNNPKTSVVTHTKEEPITSTGLDSKVTVEDEKPDPIGIDASSSKQIKSVTSSQSELDEHHKLKYSVAINNQKFITTTAGIKSGQSLFNVQMNTYGIATGSFVVISEVHPQWLEVDFSVAQIARNTYRLSAKYSATDLYTWYKKLSSDGRFETVELEVDYSGKTYVPEY